MKTFNRILVCVLILVLTFTSLVACVDKSEQTAPPSNNENKGPEVNDSEVENGEVQKPEIDNGEVEGPNIDNGEIEKPEIEGPEIDGPNIVGPSEDDKTPEVDDPDDPYDDIKEAFVELKFNNINMKPIELENIKIDDIVLKNANIKGIESIEIEVTTIDDEFIHIVYDEFVNSFGDNVDWTKILIDLGITAVITAVTVTLSFVGGPVGTFFGAVVASEYSAVPVILGAAIDAAVSGWEAYKEGGDREYILGHMLNGVVDGFKWGALFAPASTAVETGIKSLRAVSKLKKLPGMNGLSSKNGKTIFKNMNNFVNATNGMTKNASEKAIQEAYTKMGKEFCGEISESVFKKMLLNKKQLLKFVVDYNPYYVSKSVVKSMRKNFFSSSGLADDVIEKVVKTLKNPLTSSIDDVADAVARQFIEENVDEFSELFGQTVSKKFINSMLVKQYGSDLISSIADNVATSSNAYSILVKRWGKETIDNMLSDYSTQMLLQIRFGAKNINKVMALSQMYNCIKLGNEISMDTIDSIFTGMVKGNVKSLADVSKISKQAAKNLMSTSEITVNALKNLKLSNKMAGFIDELTVNKAMHVLRKDIVDEKMIADIIGNRLSKTDIVKKYGAIVYDELLDKTQNVIGALNLASKSNRTLTKEIFTDTLTNKGLTDDAIKKIINGASMESWGLADDVLDDVGNIILTYYQGANKMTYEKFVEDFAEARCQKAVKFVKEYNSLHPDTPINMHNGQYAGHIAPAPSSYIAQKYGNIQYNSLGSPIFDQHAVARVVINNLTGDSASDIALANMRHHGNAVNIVGYTWHHLEDGKTLILIPYELHEAYRHTGGASLIRLGLNGMVNA